MGGHSGGIWGIMGGCGNMGGCGRIWGDIG